MSVIVINALTELAAAPAMKQFKRTWWELGEKGKKTNKNSTSSKRTIYVPEKPL